MSDDTKHFTEYLYATKTPMELELMRGNFNELNAICFLVNQNEFEEGVQAALDLHREDLERAS